MTGNDKAKLADAFKERIKLRATFINGLAIGVILIGAFTPMTRAAYDPAFRAEALVSVALSATILLRNRFRPTLLRMASSGRTG